MGTHTYATLDVSAEAYAEIRASLVKAGYGHALLVERGGREVIDMSGFALTVSNTVRTCQKCGARVVGHRLAPCCLE